LFFVILPFDILIIGAYDFSKTAEVSEADGQKKKKKKKSNSLSMFQGRVTEISIVTAVDEGSDGGRHLVPSPH